MKLHLGCGTRYLEGYVNVDFPAAEHTVQAGLQADLYADITALSYPAGSVEEVRLHHVFEHFSRPVALALLCRWRDWLAPGGRLRIETPDLMASARLLVSPFRSYDKKQQVIRHLFGSHEARWAIHWDGWYRERFAVTLRALGYREPRFRRNRWGPLRNIEVFAEKGPQSFAVEDYAAAVRSLLVPSTVRVRTVRREVPEGSEARMLEVWMDLWRAAYEGRAAEGG